MRLISSGMLRSKLRSPASTWARGNDILLATRPAAIVDVTSPTTITRLGRASVNTQASRTMVSAAAATHEPGVAPTVAAGPGDLAPGENPPDQPVAEGRPVV